MDLKDKLRKLVSIIEKYNKIIVAYSGGVDSCLLVFLCKYLNKDILAVTASSEIRSKEEVLFSKKFAKKYKIKHKTVKTDELADSRFVKNTLLRCYYCKIQLYRVLSKLKEKYNYDVIFDGVNLDDIKNDFRPGVNAADRFKVVHPFVEAKITKEDIRKIAKKFMLELWNKPPSTCFATRIPFGTKITRQLLKKVEQAENVVKRYWERFFRLRDHGDIARIELIKQDIKNFLSKVNFEKLTKELKSLGYKFVTLDLEGYIPAGRRIKNT